MHSRSPKRRRVTARMPCQQDGAGVHVHIHPQNGILLYRNWAHDLTVARRQTPIRAHNSHTHPSPQVKAFRFDRVNRPDATWGTNGTVLGEFQRHTG